MTTRPATSCPNLNHRRSDAPVPYCPQCGALVNSRHPVAACTEDDHASARRQQTTFCTRCGVRLIALRVAVRSGIGMADGERWR